MKRFITLSITILLVMVFSLTAFAATTISLSANNTTINTGDKVTITVAANVDACAQGGIEVAYDTKVFTMISGECNVSTADIKYFDAKAGDGGFAFEKETSISGTAFTFTLQAKENAAPGASDVSVKFKTEKDTATRSITIKIACVHKYDNDCDTTCNICGASREAKHAWNKGTETKKATCSADGEKTYTCTACNKTKTEVITKLAHVYDNACDTACNSCGATRTAEHNWTPQYDNTNHWYKCKTCGKTKDTAKHNTPSTYTTTSKVHGYKCKDCGAMVNEEKHKFTNDCDTSCSVCNYTRTITHNYSTKWSYDETKHWHACTSCGDKLEAVSHKPGPAATETSDQICTECGYVLSPAAKHEHKMAGDWLNDSIGHWYRCACGEQSKPDVHKWGEQHTKDGNLVTVCEECGYERVDGPAPTEPTTDNTAPTEDTKPAQRPTEPQEKPEKQSWWDRLPWQEIALWSILVAAVSIGLNVFLIWLIINRRNRGGKYAR